MEGQEVSVVARWASPPAVTSPPMTDRRDDFARLTVADTLEVARRALRSVGMRLRDAEDRSAYQLAADMSDDARRLANKLRGNDTKRAELDALL